MANENTENTGTNTDTNEAPKKKRGVPLNYKHPVSWAAFGIVEAEAEAAWFTVPTKEEAIAAFKEKFGEEPVKVLGPARLPRMLREPKAAKLQKNYDLETLRIEDRREFAEMHGWKVLVQYTNQPDCVFVIAQSRIRADASRTPPNGLQPSEDVKPLETSENK